MDSLAEGYIGQEKLNYGADGTWEKIVGAYKKGTIYQARVSTVGKKNGDDQGGGPGLIIRIGRVQGIIPFEDSSLKTPENASHIVGQIVAFKIKEIDASKQTFTASRREALEQMAGLTWKTIAPGQVRVAVVRAVTRYRAIVDIGGVTASIPAKEVSNYWVDDVRDFLGIGDTLDVKVLEVDHDHKKIGISVRALQPDPWLNDPDKLPYENQRVLGTVAAVADNGDRYAVRINVEPGFVCFHSCKKNRYIRYAKGDRVLVRVREVDCQKRLILVNIIEQRNRSCRSAI